MSVIFTATHEVGNLSEYTASSGADISVAAGAALAGTTKGMNILCDDGTADYAWKTLSPVNTSGKARSRFYFDPNSISISAGGYITIFTFNQTSTAEVGNVYIYNESGVYKIYGKIINDAGTYLSATGIAITDDPHYIEFYIQRAVTNVSSDGSISIWVDGASLQTVTGVDNYDRFVDLKYINMGARSFSGTISGTFYCDELKVNDDGGLIGGAATINLLSGKMDIRGKL